MHFFLAFFERKKGKQKPNNLRLRFPERVLRRDDFLWYLLRFMRGRLPRAGRAIKSELGPLPPSLRIGRKTKGRQI